jgi:hypothetical protein
MTAVYHFELCPSVVILPCLVLKPEKKNTKPSKLVQAVLLMTCIWEVPSSNFGWDAGYPS